MPGEANDVRGLNILPFNLPPDSEAYANAGYTNYQVEDDALDSSAILLKVLRKKKSHRQDYNCVNYTEQTIRDYIETVFSQITVKFLKSIHAVTFEGFLLNVESFVYSFVYSFRGCLKSLKQCMDCLLQLKPPADESRATQTKSTEVD